MLESCPITLTDAAIDHLRSILEDQNDENLRLRVYVSGGGCSGLQYGMALDTVVDPDDDVFEYSGVPVILSAIDVKYLNGAEVDYIINPMGGGWVSYEKDLPTNTALPFLQKYETNDNIRMETLAWAQPNGWMWKIPTQERYGCGYVYCDSFTSEDGAIAELEKTIGKSVEPIRKIKFDVGRLDKFWVKNVVAIGLSSGFLEPLQATSIHCTTMQIHILMNLTLSFTTDMNDIIYDTNIRRYNNIIGKLFDEFKDLLQLHYMTKRNDSEFWKYCKDSLERTDKVKEILEICKHKSPSMIDFKMSHGAAGWAVWGWTLVGLGHISKETAKKTLEANSMMEYALKRFDEINHYNRLNSVRMMKNDAFMKSLLKKEFIKK